MKSAKYIVSIDVASLNRILDRDNLPQGWEVKENGKGKEMLAITTTVDLPTSQSDVDDLIATHGIGKICDWLSVGVKLEKSRTTRTPLTAQMSDNAKVKAATMYFLDGHMAEMVDWTNDPDNDGLSGEAKMLKYYNEHMA